jgi:hypothetical protein
MGWFPEDKVGPITPSLLYVILCLNTPHKHDTQLVDYTIAILHKHEQNK